MPAASWWLDGTERVDTHPADTIPGAKCRACVAVGPAGGSPPRASHPAWLGPQSHVDFLASNCSKPACALEAMAARKRYPFGHALCEESLVNAGDGCRLNPEVRRPSMPLARCTLRQVARSFLRPVLPQPREFQDGHLLSLRASEPIPTLNPEEPKESGQGVN